MPNSKGSQLPILSAVSDDDTFVVIDNPLVTPSTRQVSFGNIKKCFYRQAEVDNDDYEIAETDLTVMQVGVLSAVRQFTLPAAAAVPKGYRIVIADDSGTPDDTNYISIVKTGSDTINGAATALTIKKAYGAVTLYSDGISNWVFPIDGMLAENNLSELPSASTARDNLGLGDAAVLDVGTSAGTVAAGNDSRFLSLGTSAGTAAEGNDSRITGAAQKASNLSDLASAATARTNLGLDAMASIKSKLDATTAPGVGDDAADGYTVGSVWIDVTGAKIYQCVDATNGAAVWKLLSYYHDPRHKQITLVVDGGGVALTTGFKGFAFVTFAGTIKSATIIADQSGSVVIDVWKRAFSSGLPTVSHSIAPSDKPTLSTAQTSQDTNLVGWSTHALAAGDVIGFNIDSVSTITRLLLVLDVEEA